MKKNITFAIEESLLKSLQHIASCQHKAIDDIFKEWANCYVSQCSGVGTYYKKLMKRLHYADSGGTFSREEMNER